MQHLDPKLREKIDAAFIQAKKLLKEGSINEALELGKEAWHMLPEPKFDWDVTQSYTHAMATLYRDAKKYDVAIALMKEMLASRELKPYQDRPYFILGTIYYEKGDMQEARYWLKKADKISRGRCFQEEPVKYKEAIDPKHETPDEPSEAHLGKINTLAEEGNRLFDQGKYTQAIKKWQSALPLLPSPRSQYEAAMWLNASIGDAYYQLNAFDKAKEAFFDALNFPDANNPFAYYRLGQIAYKEKQTPEALDYFTRAYMLDGKEIFEADSSEGEAYLNELKKEGIAK